MVILLVMKVGTRVTVLVMFIAVVLQLIHILPTPELPQVPEFIVNLPQLILMAIQLVMPVGYSAPISVMLILAQDMV